MRVLAAIAAAADKGVNRIAIKTIELLQGSARFRGALSRGGGNQSPLSREEVGPRAGRRVQWRVHYTWFWQKVPLASRKRAPSVGSAHRRFFFAFFLKLPANFSGEQDMQTISSGTKAHMFRPSQPPSM